MICIMLRPSVESTGDSFPKLANVMPDKVASPLMPGIHAFLDSTGCGSKDAGGRDIGERSDAVLRAAMPGHDGIEKYYMNAWMPVWARPRISAWISWVPS